MRFLIFLAIIGTALAVPKNGQRIVGGAPTTIERYPYMSNMQYGWFGIIWYQACGGSLITASHVVSAAHCYEGDRPSDWEVVLGTSMASSGGERHVVTKIIIHAEYSSATLQHDVAILRLASEVDTLRPHVRSIAILGPNWPKLPDGTPLTAIGWGTTSSGGSSSEQLQSVDIYQIDQEVCAARYAYLKTQPGFENLPDITPGMLCTGLLDVGGKDACQGDSGGPVALYGASGGDVLFGIVSWGYGCGHETYPGVVTSVSYYSDWIRITSRDN